MNRELRKRIVETVYRGKDGHIPSAFSITDILDVLYSDYLKYDSSNPEWPGRDFFVLSKGHGCVALYAVLEKQGFLTEDDMYTFCQEGGILGEHPDRTQVPGVEASTGSLGHGLPFAMGNALAYRIRRMPNRVFVVVGDGESNEGTIWETALVAANLKLGNFCCIIDNNGSSDQILPVAPLKDKWEAFGWETYVVDGHDEAALKGVLDQLEFSPVGKPKAIVANTLKGKGVAMLEGHGTWHHRIPNEEEYHQIMEALS